MSAPVDRDGRGERLAHAVDMPIHVTPDRIAARAGTTATVTVSVFNTSEIIDAFVVALVGTDERWVSSEPAEVRLFPDKAETIALSLSVPGDFPAGLHDLGVRVTSRTTGAVVASSTVGLEVGEWANARIEMDPAEVIGGRSARFGVILTNGGNVPTDISLSADDKLNELRYDIAPQHQHLQPGETALSQILVSGPRPFTGIPVARQFILTAQGPKLERPLEMPATFITRPWVPRWALTFLTIAMLLGLWAFVVGLAIDAILADADEDLTTAFADGMQSVVAAIAPEAVAAAASDAPPGSGAEASAALAAAGVIRGPEGTVTGMMTAGVDGSPIAGATVLAVPLVGAGSLDGQVDASREPVETTVAEDGTFVFTDMVEGEYILLASAPGFVTPQLPGPGEVYDCPEPGSPAAPCISVPTDPDAEPVMFSLDGEPGLISGIVTNMGEPQPGAVVFTSRLLDPMGALDASVIPSGSVETADNGRFALDDLETPATYELVVQLDGFVTQRLVVPLDAGQRLIELDVPVVPSGIGTVSGAVTDRVTGAQLGGVAVQLESTSGAFSIASTTLTVPTEGRGVGTYVASGVPVGDYTAVFSLDGYEDLALPVSITTDDPVVTLNARMIPAAGPDGAPVGTVSGRVVDSLTGDGIPGVTVEVGGRNGTFTTSTLSGGSAGSYAIAGLPIGTYTVSFSAEHYQPSAAPFEISIDDVEPTANAALDIVVTPVTGTVRVISGTAGNPVIEPLPGVTILFDPTPADPDDPPLTLGTTNATGNYAVSVPAQPGIRTLVFDGTFLVPTIEIVVDPGSPVAAGDTTLVRLFDLEGTLIDEFGRSFADVVSLYPAQAGDLTVRISDLDAAFDLFSVDLGDSAYTTTVPLGETVTFTQLPGPGTYTFEITMPPGPARFVSTVSEAAPVDESSPTHDFTVPFAPGVLWGTATTDGGPASDQRIRLFQIIGSGSTEIAQRLATQVTDAQGRVAFPPLTQPDMLELRLIDQAPVRVCVPRIDFAGPAASQQFTVDCPP